MKSVVLVPAVLVAACAATPSGKVAVTNAWAQPLDASGRSVAVYMTIAATCGSEDRLRSVAATPPLDASLHRSSVVDDALRMVPLPSIAIACGTQTLLKPMGRHVMVTDLPQPVEIGSRIPLTLAFEKAGDVAVTAEVTTMAVLENVDPMHMHAKHGVMTTHGNMHGM